ncbi:PilW family protein [Lysobacter auxotrophicus]|uniref:PilW family protein n=1 Tax=Lysobacter auxotrophicus TaxID=2992573 RepID=A0ABM8DG80_9GAMM|nr:PilW family protein [Lysobacter auxotrophicus]BDU17573.1 PilW family protein [Lysobacter auxotrophicus]
MKTLHPSIARKAAGLSLIELMIAMVIGLILLMGLVQVMSASRAAYQLSTGVARTQENARFAVDFLQRDLRMAGHMGCVNDQSHMAPESPGSTDASRQGMNLWFLTKAQRDARTFTALSGTSYPLRFDMGVQGFEAQGTSPQDTVTLTDGTPVAGNANQWVPALPTAIADLKPVPGSDIVVIRFLSRDGVPATLASTSATNYTVTPEAYGTSVSTTDSTGLFALADCQQVSIFAADAISAAGVITVSNTGLNKSGLVGDEWSFESTQNKPVLYRAETVVYFVGVGEGTNVDGTKPPSLWRARAIATAGAVKFEKEELVEGVDSLQLLYGMDENLPVALPRGNIERVRTAAAVNTAPTNNPTNAQADEWRRVGTVQIGLLMRSSDRSASEQAAVTPILLGVKMQRGANDSRSDGHYRSVYETTVVMRNRLFGN